MLLIHKKKKTRDRWGTRKRKLRSGKASRMFIVPLSLKPSRISQGLKDKGQATYPATPWPFRWGMTYFSEFIHHHVSTSEVLIWRLKGWKFADGWFGPQLVFSSIHYQSFKTRRRMYTRRWINWPIHTMVYSTAVKKQELYELIWVIFRIY